MKTLLNVTDRSEILQRLEQLRSDSPRLWGQMSPNQMVCHLCDSFRSNLGEKFIRPADTLIGRSLMKWAALWLPARWPKGFSTRPEVDQLKGGTPPADFANDVAELKNLLARVCSLGSKKTFHPIFGPMSETDRLRHGYLHMDHHLRQFGL
jgi:hypothetical protein